MQDVERKLNLETLTTAKIGGDEELILVSEVLVRERRAKIRIEFAINANVASDEEEGEALSVSTAVTASVKVVYGDGLAAQEKKFNDLVKKGLGAGAADFDGWESVVRDLKAQVASPSSQQQQIQGLPVPVATPAADKGMKSRLARRK